MSTEERIARTRDRMAADGLDALLVRHNSDLRWLTGLAGVFDEEDAHAALITPTELFFHTDSRYSETFRARLAGTDWQLDDEPCSPVMSSVRLLDRGTGRLGVEHDLRLCEYRVLERALAEEGLAPELVECRHLIFDLRARKDADELELIRQAQGMADAAFTHLCSWMHVGMTEREVALELEFFMRGQGSEALAFPSIVATGAHGASPHSVPSERQLETGDMVVLDFGARLADYRSDMTRTVCMGSPSARQREVYAIVEDVNRRAAELVRPGVRCSDVHAFAEKTIADAGFGGRFGHGLGHGVGIDIHEMPTLSPRSEALLEVGNVVTVEPGIYLPGEFGVRIEDFGVVREGSFEVFCTSPHELMVL